MTGTLLGIDIGTTATKALLLDPERGVVAEESAPTELLSPHPGWAEEDPFAWWRNVTALTHRLAGRRQIVAVGVSGMVPCVIPIDATGNPLRPSIQQNDTRAATEITELSEELSGHRLLERTGSVLSQQSVAPTLRWLARHEPEVWSRTRWVMGSYDWIVFRLTGEPVVEANWALESGLWDLETGDWAGDVLEAVGIPRELLPPVARPSQVVGRVNKTAAEETGLPEGVPVVAGSADHVASAFASGALEPDTLVVKLGGAGDILLTTDQPVVDRRLYLDFHLLPDRFLSNGCMAASGTALRWFQRAVAGGAPLSVLDDEAETAGAGAGGVVALPYLLGEKTPIHDPAARAAFVGIHAGHQRGHLFRALLESVAFGFRHHLDVFADLGQVPTRAKVTDGGARSSAWVQIIADVLGLPLERVETVGGSALGVAYCAGVGAGTFDGWEDINRYARVDRIFEPRPQDVYEERYRQYRALYPALKEVLK